MKILIAIDGSRASLGTLRFAAQFVQRAGEPPTILCVIGRSSYKHSKRLEDTFNTARSNWQTTVFKILTLSQMVHALAIHSGRESIFNIDLMSKKFYNEQRSLPSPCN